MRPKGLVPPRYQQPNQTHMHPSIPPPHVNSPLSPDLILMPNASTGVLSVTVLSTRPDCPRETSPCSEEDNQQGLKGPLSSVSES